MARSARTPIVQQMERAECGAACLGIILGYHGRWVPLEQLRAECGVSRDGSRASNVVRAARMHNLAADGHKVPIETIAETPVPFIAFWGFNHFVVVEGFRGSHVAINDPAAGRKRITFEEFDHNYTGVILSLTPDAGFERGGHRPSIREGLKSRYEQSRLAILFVASVSLVMVVPGILAPNFSRMFTDFLLVRKFPGWLGPLVGAMVTAGLMQAMLTFIQQTYLLRLETKVSVTSASAFLNRMVRLPIGFFGQRSPSELAVRVSHNEALASVATGGVGTALLGLPSALIFGSVLLAFDVWLGLLAIAFAAINITVLVTIARTLAEREQAVMIQQTKITGAGASGLRMIAEYKAAGAEPLLFRRIVGLKAHQETLNAGLQPVRLGLQAVPAVVNGLASAALVTIGGFQVISGSVTVGVLVAVQALMMSFLTPITQLVGMGQQVQTARGYLTQIDDLMAQPVAQEFADESNDFRSASSQASGAATLRRATFGYSPLDPPLLRDFTLDVAPGEWVAVVGRSGSGKSTVAKLMAGLERPWSGDVLLDGKPIQTISRNLLRNSISVVEQDIVIFEGSVRDNIAMWDPTLPDEAIIGAAKLVGVHEFIVSRPGGYDAKLSEDGANISGGQRALIDLARAVATRPALLVMDEATAALDAASEETVIANLRKLGCGCLMVAHRLSTVRTADRIVVLQDGVMAESGTHAQLMARDGLYADLIRTA